MDDAKLSHMTELFASYLEEAIGCAHIDWLAHGLDMTSDIMPDGLSYKDV